MLMTISDPEEWKTLEDEHFIVKFLSGYGNDAKEILGYADFAREVVMAKFPHELSTKVTIYIYKGPTYVNNRYLNWGHMSSDYMKGEIHVLAPSGAIKQSSCYDDLWHRKNVIHEYVHVVVGRDIYSKTGKYMGNYLPPWFNEGIAEYFAIFCSTPEILQKYDADLNDVRQMVKRGEGYLLFVAVNKNYGGAYIVKYMYETYGQEAVKDVIESDAPSFAQALAKELNVTGRKFEDNWLKWACEEFDADYSLYPV